MRLCKGLEKNRDPCHLNRCVEVPTLLKCIIKGNQSAHTPLEEVSLRARYEVGNKN